MKSCYTGPLFLNSSNCILKKRFGFDIARLSNNTSVDLTPYFEYILINIILVFFLCPRNHCRERFKRVCEIIYDPFTTYFMK